MKKTNLDEILLYLLQHLEADFCFRVGAQKGEVPDPDAANYVNRAPFPAFHLLRALERSFWTVAFLLEDSRRLE